MRFDKEKKEAILRYLLEKLSEKAPNPVKLVSENFGINPNTVHTYLKELEAKGIIRKLKRGTYELAKETHSFTLFRAKGEIRDEQKIFDAHIRQHLQGLPDNVRNIWDYILGEMLNNVIDHSGAESLRVLIERDSLLTRLTISDDGVGIFRKIMEHFHMDSMDEAICELFKGKLTTDPVNHSGEGIFFSSRLADLFVIVSDGKCFSINKYDHDVLQDVSTDGGTVVLVELSNSSNKTAAEIFNRYSQIDGGFQQTMIPLRSMFDTAPVSRSQAKRVCQRLDSFKEVIFDFEGLSWIGQGFAHQVFVVFHNAHPDVTLTPINMSKDVETMYLHVTATNA